MKGKAHASGWTRRAPTATTTNELSEHHNHDDDINKNTQHFTPTSTTTTSRDSHSSPTTTVSTPKNNAENDANYNNHDNSEKRAWSRVGEDDNDGSLPFSLLFTTRASPRPPNQALEERAAWAAESTTTDATNENKNT